MDSRSTISEKMPDNRPQKTPPSSGGPAGMVSKRFVTSSPQATRDLGAHLGEHCQPGDTLALIGELGSGKTCFTQGLCASLGINQKSVISPTYAFVNQYSGRLPVLHLDLYRIESIEAAMDLGLMDYFESGKAGIVIMEWADRILPLLGMDYIRIDFTMLSPKRREIVVSGSQQQTERLLAGLGK